jgi:hypothetical protein
MSESESVLEFEFEGVVRRASPESVGVHVAVAEHGLGLGLGLEHPRPKTSTTP